MLNQLNSFVPENERIHKCADQHVDFMDLEKPLHLKGLVTRGGVVGIPEANNFKHIAKGIPILGVVCDLHTQTSLHITPHVVAYVEIVRSVYGRWSRQ